ncbi:lantibiotic dehydratase C-terminal domain-containing protein [Nonomuraea recticatena]|uniref:lantibiotic dehydratase C-terminal domain-containing protein n=1 Tax=Nonomuraea recticatena TaxID=46178 RepID=UPI00362305F8
MAAVPDAPRRPARRLPGGAPKRDQAHRPGRRLARTGLPAGGAELLETWRARRPALAAYGNTVREAEAGNRLSGSRFTVVTSLLHMHHNRLVGIRPAAERRTLAILRGVVEAHLSRKRYMA